LFATKLDVIKKLVVTLACAVLLYHLGVLNIPAAYSCCPIIRELDIEADVGSMHFRGEMAEFYILVSHMGKPINAEITTILYYNGTLHANLTTPVEHVDTGLYRVPYIIPTEASAGTYALVVNASTCTLRGITLESFLLSPTLTGWNAWLINMQGDLVIIKTDITTIKASLEAIDAKLVSIDGRIATIETDLGIIKADVDNINLTLVSIKGDVATITTVLGNINGTLVSIQGDIANIKTDLGYIKVSLPPPQTTTLGIPITSIFAIVAAIASSISAALLLRKRSH
jgi:hypothetical protein